MDLGIRGRKGLVCAASKGLGFGCAAALAEAGVELTLVARTAETLEAAAGQLAEKYGATVHTVTADITSTAGQEAALAACPAPDILVNNAGGPPPGDFRDWERSDWIAALDANMLTPILLIRAVVDGMIERGFGRIINITSAAVKAPIPILGLSNGARAGLTGFVAGLARETVSHNVTINNLLPGPFATDRLKQTISLAAEQQGRSFDAIWKEREAQNPARRFGDPAEFGSACAFLCSTHASYITGQNLLIDGGAYPGTL